MGEYLDEGERQERSLLAEIERLRNDKDDQYGRALLYLAERDEARFQACCLAHRIRQCRHLPLTDLHKELAAAEEACEWIKPVDSKLLEAE